MKVNVVIWTRLTFLSVLQQKRKQCHDGYPISTDTMDGSFTG